MGTRGARTREARDVRRDRRRRAKARSGWRWSWVLLGAVTLLPTVAGAAVTLASTGSDLVTLSLEELANVVVTSVSRREERLGDAPASIFVITGQEIRRSRATSIPEALRLAPNLDVARADINQYAISARGFDNVLANKMLVLIDGRTVYTPLFSGVFWEAQDTLLEDVDRIEVISGPGATLWGANAVNGVINIITKSAHDTQGALAVGILGDRHSGAAVRYGGALDPTAHYRVYAKYDDRDASELATGGSTHDASIHGQTGFRADWQRGADAMTLQGDAYFGRLEQVASTRTISGANVLGRFRRDLAGGRTVQVQAYVDSTTRDHPASFHEDLTVADVEAQYGGELWSGHRIVLGGGYRYAWDRVGNSPAQAFLPANVDLSWAHVLAQDDIALSPTVDLTAGAKVETNHYTGAEFLPNLRLAWRPTTGRLVWGALSRAVRAPSRFDRELYVPGVAPYALLQGDSGFRSEVSNVAELGYRSQPSANLSYSLTGFYHQHEHLRSYELEPGHPHWGNLAKGHTHGVEGWTSWRPTSNWRLTAGGVVLREHLRLESGSLDPGIGLPQLGNDPPYWWSVRSSLDITARHEFDLTFRRVGARPNPAVPAYDAVDARLGWKVSPALELSIVLQNALDPEHAEWGGPANRALIQRAAFVKVLVRL